MTPIVHSGSLLGHPATKEWRDEVLAPVLADWSWLSAHQKNRIKKEARIDLPYDGDDLVRAILGECYFGFINWHFAEKIAAAKESRNGKPTLMPAVVYTAWTADRWCKPYGKIRMALRPVLDNHEQCGPKFPCRVVWTEAGSSVTRWKTSCRGKDSQSQAVPAALLEVSVEIITPTGMELLKGSRGTVEYKNYIDDGENPDHHAINWLLEEDQ